MYDWNEYVWLIDGEEQKSFSEALEHERKEEQLHVMQKEMVYLWENHTYDLVKFLKSKRDLKNK